MNWETGRSWSETQIRLGHVADHENHSCPDVRCAPSLFQHSYYSHRHEVSARLDFGKVSEIRDLTFVNG